jgi:hypothetical protein
MGISTFFTASAFSIAAHPKINILKAKEDFRRISRPPC